MRVFGIGIDVVEVERFAVAIEKHGERYLQKIFTPAERAYCDVQKNSVLSYAARFAAKEAASKALGTGIGKHAGLHDLEVARDDRGAPKLILSGAAKAFALEHRILEIQISLSHTRDYAAANAIALAED